MKKGMKILTATLVAATAVAAIPVISLGANDYSYTSPTRFWSITIHTAGDSGAGTDSDISAIIHYADGSQLQELVLDKSNYNDFERNDRDTYTFEIENKAISEVELKYDHSDKWKVDWITYDNNVFNLNRWFTEDQSYFLNPANKAPGAGNIDLTINTSPIDGSGTDGDVYATVKYADGTSGEKTLLDKSGYNDFERNDTDTYPLRTNGKEVAAVELYCHTGDDWRCQFVEVNGSRYAVNHVFNKENDTFTVNLNGPTARWRIVEIHTFDSNCTGLTTDAGTDSDIFLEFVFTDGTRSGQLLLDLPGYNDFEFDDDDEYAVVVDNKDIAQLILTNSGTDKWIFEEVFFEGSGYVTHVELEKGGAADSWTWNIKPLDGE